MGIIQQQFAGFLYWRPQFLSHIVLLDPNYLIPITSYFPFNQYKFKAFIQKM